MSGKLRAAGLSSSSAAFDSFYFSSYSTAADEAEVAGVLFRLPDLIRKFESARRFPPCWGGKRRRSSIDAPPVSDSPELPPLNGKLAYVSRSPTSPLTFSSHADLDSKRVISDKDLAPSGFKVGEDWLKGCGRSIESREKSNGVQESAGSSSKSESLEVQLFRRSQPLVHHHYQQELGPRGIPDLNVPAEECADGVEWAPPPVEPFERRYMAAAAESRAEAAALARQRRHLIQKCKKATRGAR